MRLDAVIARVRAETDTGMLIADARIENLVRRTIAALGLQVATDGEVYNPAAQDRFALTPVAEDNSRRYSGRFRKRR